MKLIQDMQWLAETTGIKVDGFQSAAIRGNEDCPLKVHLYQIREPSGR
jgi:hypothetical protein